MIQNHIHEKRPFILELPSSCIRYSLNGKDFFRYFSPILIHQTCNVVVHFADHTETIECVIEAGSNEHRRGAIFIIGGADKNQEIHEAIIKTSGGVHQARIAFIPAGSANPYAAGMDRLVRFERYCNLPVDRNLVPLKNGKYDFSDLRNESCFWIVPVAVIDDDQTTSTPTNDPDHVLNDESTYPDINEATWSNGGFSATIARKLLYGNYNIIFFTGGNQKRYLKTLFNPDGTPGTLMQVILYLHHYHGAIIAGTSAGATSLSNTMLIEGHSVDSFFHPVQVLPLADQQHQAEKSYSSNGQLLIGKGIGLLNEQILIDTHFSERNRQPRLLKALEYFMQHISIKTAIGIDEDTALLKHFSTFEVIGKNTVSVFTPISSNEFTFHILNHKDTISAIKNNISGFQLKPAGQPYLTDTLPSHPFDFFPAQQSHFIATAIDTLSSRHSDIAILVLLKENHFYLDEPLKESKLLIITKTPETRTFLSTQIIHDFGYRDRYFPDILTHEFETISVINGHLIVQSVTFHPPNPFADAPSIRNERDFRKNKKTYIALIYFRLGDQHIYHASFIDYAYLEHDGLQIETEPCEQAEIIHNYSSIGRLDMNGFLRCPSKYDHFTIKTKGQTVVHFKNISDQTDACILLKRPY